MYREKEITKTVHKNYYQFNKGIIYKRNTTFMNSENSKTSDEEKR